MSKTVYTAAHFIKKQCGGFTPTLGVILGSGLGELVDAIQDATVIPYTDIPNFPNCTVAGHEGRLHLGYLHNISVACLEGRVHYYEGASNKDLQIPIRVLKQLGCDTLLITNSAGALHPDLSVGSLVAIKDHINFQGFNPLAGPNEDTVGPRFIGMDNAYDTTLRQQLIEAAQNASVPLTEGVFIGVLGPSFETPAEINAFRQWGADVVAMSLIPEVIIARHCGLRVVAVSAVTNLAAGLHEGTLSHEITLHGAKQASTHLHDLISHFLQHFYTKTRPD